MNVAVFRNYADSYLPNKVRMSYLQSEASILQYQYLLIIDHSEIVCSKDDTLTVSPRSARGQPKVSSRSTQGQPTVRGNKLISVFKSMF